MSDDIEEVRACSERVVDAIVAGLDAEFGPNGLHPQEMLNGLMSAYLRTVAHVGENIDRAVYNGAAIHLEMAGRWVQSAREHGQADEVIIRMGAEAPMGRA